MSPRRFIGAAVVPPLEGEARHFRALVAGRRSRFPDGLERAFTLPRRVVCRERRALGRDYWVSNLVKPLATRARTSASPALGCVPASGSFTAQACSLAPPIENVVIASAPRGG